MHDRLINQFVSELNAKHAASGYLFSQDTGRLRTKITRTTPSFNGHPGQTSVYCFVERATGKVIKAAGWKAPQMDTVNGKKVLAYRYDLTTEFAHTMECADLHGGFLYKGRA